MNQYVGLDVSQKEVSVCVIDADGSVVAEGKVETDPTMILSWIEKHVGAVERIVHESGPLSIWLTRDLAALDRQGRALPPYDSGPSRVRVRNQSDLPL